MKVAFTMILPAALLLASCSKNSPTSNNNNTGPTGDTPTVTTFAGTGSAGAVDGTREQASFDDPTQIAIDGQGFFYVADKQNNAIRRISPQGEVNTIAGTGASGFSNTTGAITFNFPNGVAVNSGGNYIYIADQFNNAIRLLTDQAIASTFVGGGGAGFVNASDTAARFNNPAAVAVDSSGNIYVADVGNNVIRKVSSKGGVTTFAGSGQRGSLDGTGTAASFNQPQALCVDGAGNVYVADQGNNTIRKITAQGVVTTIAGNGTPGLGNGKWTASEFNHPAGIAIDNKGNLFVGDTGNNVIREINIGGIVSTYAGSGQSGANNGTLSASTFNSPQGLVVDPYGRVFVVDTGNDLIRLITP
ncbi:MAG TPA: NHL repeat-containing protein [Mucilaginibacter sp.]|nr:NHL repeat-containing protein [Mucilaginibacter sp.]